MDMQYFISGMFAVFVPVSKQGEDAWREIAKQTEGTGKVLACFASQTVQQLEDAGYKVDKISIESIKKIEITDEDLDSLLS